MSDTDFGFILAAALGVTLGAAGLLRGHKTKARASAVKPARTPAMPWGWLALRVFLAVVTLSALAVAAWLLLLFLPLAIVVAVLVAARHLNTWRGSGESSGTARWSERHDLKRAGMLDGKGLPLGRRPAPEGRDLFWQAALGLLTRPPVESAGCCAAMLHALTGRPHGAGEMIRLARYTHTLFVAPTGAGKFVSYVATILLDYLLHSAVVFDPKGEAYLKLNSYLRGVGRNVVLIDPFGAAKGHRPTGFNPLDAASLSPETICDEARSIACDMVERPPGGSKDPHWDDSAEAVLTALLCWVLSLKDARLRTLNSVRELVTDGEMFLFAAGQLVGMGGTWAQHGRYLQRLRGDPNNEPSDEFSSVISCVNRHTANLSSDRLAASLVGGFDPSAILRPGTTVFIVLPPHQFKAQKNYLRATMSALVRMAIRHGCGGGECLFLCDEAAMLGVNNDALESALQLGRSGGVRLALFYQSMAQVEAAFPEKKGLVVSNCDARIFWAVNDIETAETVSKMLGNSTITVESHDRGESTSRPIYMGDGSGGSVSSNTSTGLSEKERCLLDPAEVMNRLPQDCLIAFVRGLPPIIARRLLHYSDPEYAGKASR